jgi:tetratricopeptide (TPR) repeat protein
MGTVFMAEQEKPVRRRVALKIIKAGMDSAQVVARFEAERQALALMDHPNIARVLDAGTTESGRPYFVMELVKGIPLIDYCDQVRLSTAERLKLFVPICQSIQHAHQKGIIHRDLKPSNVLVTLIDGKPVPKVIDFGVAKAIDQRLTEKTLFTQYGAVVGTLEYMSPEQAELSGLDVDTRSDIYALGVMLYELLTGTTPLERQRLRAAGHAEILRRIREEEPPKPSTRLSSSGEKLASIAATRGTEPNRLTRMVRGDLDWIVMKAIEKDRTRRYETANGFARDVERHLSGDPVEACPPSPTYRLRKFARKHRAGLVTAAAFALLLSLAAVVSTWQAVRAMAAERLAARRLADVELANAATTKALADTRVAQAASQAALQQSEAARKQAEAISTFGIELFRSPDPSQDGRHVKVVDVLDRAAEQMEKGFVGPPEMKAALLNALGETYNSLGLYDRSITMHQQARTIREAALGPEDPLTLVSRSNLAASYLDAGRTAESIAMNEATLKSRRSKLGVDHPDTLISRNNLAAAYLASGRIAEALALHEANFKLYESRLGADHPQTLIGRNNIAEDYRAVGRIAEAVALHESNLKLCESKLGPDYPLTLTSRGNLARAYQAVGRLAEAVALDETTLKLRESKLGPDHPDTRNSRENVARAYDAAGQFARSEPLHRIALAQVRGQFGQGDLRTADVMALLGYCLIRQAKWSEAEPVLRECLAIREHAQADAWKTCNARSLLGEALLGLARYAEAEPLVLSGYEGLKTSEMAIPSEGRRRLDDASRRVVRLYEAWGKPDRVAEWKAKLGLADLPADVFQR